MIDDPAEARPRTVRNALWLALIGLVAGLPAGWAVGRWIKTMRAPDPSWSDQAALIIAISFLAAGFLTAAMTATARGRAILANRKAPDFGRPVKSPQVVFFLLQAGVLILAGAMLAVPVAFDLATSAVPQRGGAYLMAAVAVAFALQTALNLLIWRRADEVLRGVIAESGALCFWLLQGALFLWACGEKFKVLPTLSSWDAVTVMMGVYLILSTIATYRRGLG